jgi:hypothetical protein
MNQKDCPVDFSSKHQEFEALKARVQQLEADLHEVEAQTPWQPTGSYPAYHATTGFLLGGLASGAALLVNVIGAPIAGKHPLQLIRVYLTFPLGEKALALADPANPSQSVSDGMILAFGCCLFIATGMLLGMPLQLLLSRFNGKATLMKRLAIASGLALVLWIFNFYAILSWLQPLLFGGNWIVDTNYLPLWVAAGTHLVFGWTMALLYPLGQFIPYQTAAEKS